MKEKGFTLIELLIVVAIIGILAAIAVPNYLEAQTRGKVSRVRADFRNLATGIEVYHIDNASYPIGLDATTNPYPLVQLSSPIIYFSNPLLEDPFRNENGQPFPYNTLFYLLTMRAQGDCIGCTNDDDTINIQKDLYPASNGIADWWVIASRGPDGDFDEFFPELTAAGDESLAQPFLDMIYDPSNGTTSSGNIYRSGGGGGRNFGGKKISNGS